MLSILPFGFLFIVVLGFGTLFSLSSVHWLGIWAGLEINLIAFIPILVYSKGITSSESAVKYFIAQAMGSAFLILGSLIGFSPSFSWNFMDFSAHSYSISLLMVNLALILKMGAFPLHYWLPSVMAGLQWMSCLILVTWQKVAPVFLMMSFFEVSYMFWFALLMSLVGAGSSMVGGAGGIGQTQVRVLLAYSSIGHLGWIMFSIVFSSMAAKMYFFIYVLISVGIFLNLWILDAKNMISVKSFNQGFNINIVNILVLLISLAGLPPLLGFVSKMIVVMSCVNYDFIFILSFLILGSLMSLFYYLGLFFSLYFSCSSFLKIKSFVGGLKLILINTSILVINFLSALIITWLIGLF
ncbi:NADH dehydrogenase subunit 2 (mitochondrion) [Pomacea canaliculata]|uniref:NADH-ubiquinone oxidoreductase chain 2 n=1 Tax=Pomacea canaliculata TaxID=400727 RepID=A0A068FKF6_POMCA|nr:NADH dehydrogenase subunit 2 [Pomacea canaliculata]AID68209.1 NADH dehydrogenase subunit 2 [Pomacea canaliculata]AOY42379.1 NADH dehydrogenase subunit 2 [Pomacea canaliculata]ART65978.1 NADH dehydrogenase subunit 2 [Pomacea canaliculata]